MGFGRLVGRAISDSTVIKARCTHRDMFLPIVISTGDALNTLSFATLGSILPPSHSEITVGIRSV